MDVFQSLPTEIVAKIFSYLSKADLVITSYLSHQLRATSLPLLCSAPTLSSWQGRGLDPPPTALEQFLRTILTSPNEALATCVNSLTLRWRHGRSNDSEPDYPHRFRNDTDILRLSSSPMALHRLVPNTQLLLLLSRLPRLQFLDISLGLVTASSFNSFVAEFMDTLGTTPAPPSAFHSLREFQYTPQCVASGMNLNSLVVLLKLPSLDSLTVSLHITDMKEPEYGVGFTSSVTKLCLWNDGIATDELASILMIPRRLTDFSCQSPTDLPFADAMQPLQKSLEHLSLLPHTNYCKMPLLGSLRAWSELRSLRCALAHVLDSHAKPYPLHLVDVLPVGIRTLEIVDDPYDLDDTYDLEYERLPLLSSEVVALLERKDELVPKMERLTLNMAPGEERSIILEACVAAGVSFWSQIDAENGCCYNAAA